MSSVNLTGIREKLQFPLLKIFLRAFLKSTVFSCSEQRKKTLTWIVKFESKMFSNEEYKASEISLIPLGPKSRFSSTYFGDKKKFGIMITN